MPPNKSPRRWLLLAIKILIAGLLAWFMRETIRQGLDEIRKQEITLKIGWLIFAGGLYLLGQLPSGLYWLRVLHRLGQDARPYETLRAFYIGHLGKYVPGKALVIVLRAGLIRSARVDTAVVVVSVFIETLTMMAVGAALAAAIIAVEFYTNVKLLAIGVGLLLVAGVPTLPPVFRKVIRVLKVARSNPHAIAQLDRLDYRTLAMGWVGIGLGWVAIGVALWGVLRGMGMEQVELWSNLPLLIAAVALAIVAGFASLIPAGAGVREFVLIALLTQLPGVDDGHAVLSAVVLRIVTLVAELSIAGILFVVRPRQSLKE